METRTVEATVHGRFVYVDRGAARLLVGFHGYAENAETHFAELEKIPGIDAWSVAAVQALHPFYRRTGEIGASWMTSLDREAAIADNLNYVRRVLDDLPTPQTLVFAGFSQGASMAARAAALAGEAAGLILLGGDIPAEIRSDESLAIPPTLIARGSADDWYTTEKFMQDLNYLEKVTQVTRCSYEGGHEWTAAFREAASTFLRKVCQR
jgi:predicted esterase